MIVWVFEFGAGIELGTSGKTKKLSTTPKIPNEATEAEKRCSYLY
jgi:hypothetical protein